MKRIFILAVLMCFMATNYSCAQSKTTQKEKFQSTYNNLKTIVLSKSYKYEGEVVYTNKDRELLKDKLSVITISQDDINANLEALTNNTNYRTTGKIKDYKVTFDDDKQVIAIEFKKDKDEFYIDIKPNGNVFLTAVFNGKNITQIGTLKNF